jgi:hypothetical protein
MMRSRVTAARCRRAGLWYRRRAGVRYRWDGEETFGMLERSNPLDKISR